MPGHIGEIVEASTGTFKAQSYRVNGAPPFGSLVKTNDGSRDIYGVVCYVETTSLDPGRRPIARGQEALEPAQVYRENPQLEKLFRTDFQSLIVGYQEGENIRHYLPPQPSAIHGFVYVCDSQEVAKFTDSLGFLSLLVGAGMPVSSDEIVAACVRETWAARGKDRDFLVKAGRELALLLGSDPGRLRSVLERIKAPP